MSIMDTLRARKLIIPMLVIFIALLVQTSWVEEDAFITLRTSDNFIHGYGLRWNVDERVQTFTNPLWMFALAGLHGFTRNPYLTLTLLSIAASALAMFVLLTKIPQNNFGVVLAFLILVFSKAFVDYSTSGLENPATHLLAISFAALYLRAPKPLTEKNLFALSLLAGLAVFNRMDTALFYLPALAASMYGRVNKRNILILLAGLSPFILWEIFSLIYYGFVLPNTYYAKLNTGISQHELNVQGLLYFVNSLGWDPVTLTVIFSSLALTFIGKRKEQVLLALGVVCYLAYIIYIGGDYMSGRFFSAPLILSTALLVRRVEESTALEKYSWVGLVLFLGLVIAPLKSFTGPMDSDLSTFDNTTGIADERFGYYRYTNLLLLSRDQNLSLNQFTEYGFRLRDENIKVAIGNRIGMVGYFAGPGVHIIDNLAITDPLLAHLKPANPSQWRIGHFEREVPAGYFETIESGENKITDPSLAEYYDKLNLIIRGDLWSLERWVTIFKMNTGQHDYLLEEYAARGK